MTITAFHHLVLGFAVLLFWPVLLRVGIMGVISSWAAWLFLTASWSQIYIGTVKDDFPYPERTAAVLISLGLGMLIYDVFATGKDAKKRSGRKGAA